MPLQVRQIIKTKQCRRAEEKTQIIMNEDLGMTQNAERQQNTFGLWLMMGRADSNRNIFVLNLLFIYVRASEENVCRTAPIGFHQWSWPQGRLLRSRATPTWPSEELRNPHLNWIENQRGIINKVVYYIQEFMNTIDNCCRVPFFSFLRFSIYHFFSQLESN